MPASNTPLRRLQISTAATSLGKWAFVVTLSVYAFRRGGTAAVGLVALIQAGPAVLAAPVLGLAGDRYPRQRVLLVTNAARALLLAAVAFSVCEGAAEPVVFALAALFSMVSTANQPARAALIPALARSPGEVSSATAVMGTVDTASFLLGAGAGGVVLAATSVALLVALCCGAYCVATMLMLGIPVDARPARRISERPLPALAAGFHTVLSDSRLRLVLGMMATLSVIDGLSGVFVIVTAIRLLHIGTQGVGYLNIARGAGGLAGGAVAFAHVALGLVAWCGLGFGYVLVKASGIATIQRLSGDRVLARVLAVLETTLVETLGLGAILAPALESLVGLP